MELDCGSTEVCSDNTSSTKCDESIPIPKSPNDFLEQIEILDSSGLTTSLIEILESIGRTLFHNREIIDIVTHDRILIEFLQRTIDLVNRRMITGNYCLKMVNVDDSDGNN